MRCGEEIAKVGFSGPAVLEEKSSSESNHDPKEGLTDGGTSPVELEAAHHAVPVGASDVRRSTVLDQAGLQGEEELPPGTQIHERASIHTVSTIGLSVCFLAFMLMYYKR